MKLRYCEGTWFGVPLRNGGFAVGVVARATAEGKVVLCYFFGPRRDAIPMPHELEQLRPQDAVLIARVGDMSLMNRDWPIIGRTDSWNRSRWPVPPFVRRDELSGKAWRVEYSDSDPNEIEFEVPEAYESNLDRDRVLGSGAAELILTKILD